MKYDILNTCSEDVSAVSTMIKYQSEMELRQADLTNATLAGDAS